MADVWPKRPTYWSCDEEVGTPHLQATHGTLQKGFLYPLAIPNTASFVTSPQVRPLTDQQHDLLLDGLAQRRPALDELMQRHAMMLEEVKQAIGPLMDDE